MVAGIELADDLRSACGRAGRPEQTLDVQQPSGSVSAVHVPVMTCPSMVRSIMTRPIGPLVSFTPLDPAGLAAAGPGNELFAPMAAHCPHGRAEHNRG